jgi:Ni,Fe-hydrogenase III small subunit
MPIRLLHVLGRLRNLLPFRHELLTPVDSRSRQNRSIFIRHLDAGSCNDVELSLAALTNPAYDIERFGIHFVASPRHADVLLVSGPFTRSMKQATLATFRAMSRPRAVITVGDGFNPSKKLSSLYATIPLPEEMTETWVVHIAGDPPTPQQIIDVLLSIEIIDQT